MPDQMFAYRAAVFLARRYCPEVLMGMQTVEELEDVKEEKPATSTVEAIIEKIDEAKPDPPKSEEEPKKKNKPKPRKNGTKSIFVNDRTDEKTHDNKLEMIIVRAKKNGLTQEAIDRWLDEIGIDKFDEATQTEDRLIDFAARVGQHSEM